MIDFGEVTIVPLLSAPGGWAGAKERPAVSGQPRAKCMLSKDRASHDRDRNACCLLPGQPTAASFHLWPLYLDGKVPV
jgi:hypothetical protein